MANMNFDGETICQFRDIENRPCSIVRGEGTLWIGPTAGEKVHLDQETALQIANILIWWIAYGKVQKPQNRLLPGSGEAD